MCASNYYLQAILALLSQYILACLTLPCAWRCGQNGFTAGLEFSFHMVITCRNQVWLASFVRIVLPSSNKTIVNPVIPVGEQNQT